MFKKILFAAVLACAAFVGKTQTLADVKQSESLTWYGIDYSQTRFLNFGAYMSDKTVRKGLNRWSYNPFGGDDMDSWKKKYRKDDLKVENKMSAKRNEDAKYDEHMGTEPFEMTEDDIKKIVSEYDITGEGYGLLYIAECFNYLSSKKAYMWAVFINKKDKSVIDAQKTTTETYGDWALAVTNTLKQSAKALNKAK
ncbi:MAG: hypothetical protein KDC07_11810 [Chitinophagaceae bacterium]|nr:hypothetical protein [Chitinophagaceae bacterium]MCB9047321.1 hypothetical protein [Chitinophagales bacterium]